MELVLGPVGRLDLNLSSPHSVMGSGLFVGLPCGSSQTNCCPGLSAVAAPSVAPVDGYQTPVKSAPCGAACCDFCARARMQQPSKITTANETTLGSFIWKNPPAVPYAASRAHLRIPLSLRS